MKIPSRFAPVLLAALTGLVLTAFVGFSLVRERATTIQVASLETQNFARVLEEHTRQSLRRISAMMVQADDGLQQLAKAGMGKPDQQAEFLRALLPQDRIVDSFLILDAEGSVVLNTRVGEDGKPGGRSHAGRDYFTPHVRGADRELVFGAPEFLGGESQWLLPVSRRLTSANGTFSGVLVVKVMGTHFQTFYDSIERRGDGFVALFLSNGRPAVSSPDSLSVTQRDWSNTSLFRTHIPGWPTGAAREVLLGDGVEYIYSYRALNDYPVVVSYGLATQTVLSSWRQIAWRDGLLLSAAFLALVVIALVMTRHESRRRQMETDLRIAATAFDGQESIVVTDARTNILRVNHAFTQATGYSAEEVVGKTPLFYSAGREDERFLEGMWADLNEKGYWHGELWSRRKNGDEYPERTFITAVRDSQGNLTHYVASMVDVTHEKAAAHEIEQLAFFDPLTKLPNRRLLMDRLRQSIAASARHRRYGALLFLDLDHFKTLNDTKGHDVGDALLVQVAARLAEALREDDTVARLGGDEFVILLEDLSDSGTEAAELVSLVCAKVLTKLNHPYTLGPGQYHGSVSIGATLFRSQRKNIDELMKQADLAMYAAKTAGRNTVRFFDPEMQAVISAHAALEADLRQALATQQFQLYFQKQVTHEQHVLGAEVLIRWQHPQQGLVLPGQFIPHAEESGLIVPIGGWVLSAACEQLKRWEEMADFAALKLSVNVSARQFHHPDFVEQVRDVLRRTGARPQWLKLELTESTVLSNVDDAIEKMDQLKADGVQFSMDDFGTGQSSLSYLTRLPFDQIKIDQSFVRNIGIRSEDEVITQTIIGMANNLGMEIIAEGVETETQRVFLEQHGCPLCQGYLFGRPVAIEEFERLV